MVNTSTPPVESSGLRAGCTRMTRRDVPGSETERTQGHVTNIGSCPDLIRASSPRCHPLRRSLTPWTAGTVPGSELERMRGSVTHIGSCPVAMRRRVQGRATNIGSCPDLIRASRLRCHPLRRCVLLWTAGTVPGSEPEGAAKPCHSLSVIPVKTGIHAAFPHGMAAVEFSGLHQFALLPLLPVMMATRHESRFRGDDGKARDRTPLLAHARA